jgi:hypothetical protein
MVGQTALPDAGAPVSDRAAPRRAVWFWSAVGLAALVVQASVWARFLASDPQELTRYREVGSAGWIWAKVFEGSLSVLVVITVGLTVRTALQARRLTTNALLLVGFASMLWLDPMLNYFRPGFYFSTNLVNVESWVRFIPGQMAPYSELTPVPWLWVGATYLGFHLPVILLNVALMRRVAARRPGARLPVLMAPAFAFSLVTDLGLEGFALRTGTFAYPAAVHDWSLWGGRTYQFPVIEMLAAAAFWTTLATLKYVGDRDGVLPVHRGIEGVRRGATALRVLSVIGFVNVVFLLLPLGLPQLGVFFSDPFPQGYPAVLHGGWCGDHGEPYGPCR